MKKIVLNTAELLPKLTQVVGLVANKSSLPILENVLFRAKSETNELYLTTSDNESWLVVKFFALDVEEDTSFCLNAKDCLTTMRNLSDTTITLTVEESARIINGGYSNGKFSMPYVNADEYPQAPVANDLKEKGIGAQQLLAAIDKVRFAMANDELRPVMNSVHFDFLQDKLVTVATDGQKLVRYTDENAKGEDSVDYFTLPKKPANLLPLLLQKENGMVSVRFNDKNAVVSSDGFHLVTRLLEARYPNYNTVIPDRANLPKKAIVNKDAILGALKRVMPMGNMSIELVKLSFGNNRVTISTENLDFSTSASEYIDCDYSGEEFAIGFKGSFLVQVIQNVNDDEIQMAFTDKSHAAIIEPKTQLDGFDYISILMPMLIN